MYSQSVHVTSKPSRHCDELNCRRTGIRFSVVVTFDSVSYGMEFRASSLGLKRPDHLLPMTKVFRCLPWTLQAHDAEYRKSKHELLHPHSSSPNHFGLLKALFNNEAVRGGLLGFYTTLHGFRYFGFRSGEKWEG